MTDTSTPASPGAQPRSFGRLLALVFVPFACGYFLSFLLRNINAVVFPELVVAFGLGPGALGFLTSTYFLVFAAFQLPLGLLLDQFGPRRVNAALLVVAAAGATAFGLAQTFTQLVAGRALMGLGCAGCLMSSMTAFVLWFPRDRMATLTGAMVGIGACGALAATKPVELALRAVEWRTVFLVLAVAIIVAAVVITAIVPDKPRSQPHTRFSEQLRGLARILADREFWRIGLLAAFVQANGLAVLGLWAGPWLRDVAGLGRADVAFGLLIAAACFGIGAISYGALSDRLARRGIPARSTYHAGCALAAVALLGLVSGGLGSPVAVLAIFTGCSAAGTLAFALLTTRFPSEMAGRVVTALNVLTMGAAFLFQAGLGAVLHLWPATDGVYAPQGYRAGFALLLAGHALVLIHGLLARRPRHEEHRRPL